MWEQGNTESPSPLPQQSHKSPKQGLGPAITLAGQRNGPHRATSDIWASLRVAPSKIPHQAEFSKLSLPQIYCTLAIWCSSTRKIKYPSGQCWKLPWHQWSALDVINWGQTGTWRSRCDRRASTLVPLRNGQESLPFMAAPSTLEEITLFVFTGKADPVPASQGQTGRCSLWTGNCALGGFWFSVKCQYFLWKEAHLFWLIPYQKEFRCLWCFAELPLLYG